MISRRTFLATAAAVAATGLAGCSSHPASSGSTPTPAHPISPRLPDQVVGGYWRADLGAPSPEIPPAYNLLYLFHAVPRRSGTLRLPSAMPDDLDRQLAAFRERMPVVLTAGGARASLQFTSRSVSERFVESVGDLIEDIGEVDGIDLNTYEDGTPNTEEYIWVANELKDTYGPQFLVTTPPAPWSEPDLELCAAMVDAGVLDLVSPQFYDGPGLARQSTIDQYRSRWVRAVGAERLGLGLGLAGRQNGQENYMSVEQCLSAWQSTRDEGLRGVYLWSIESDQEAGWPFAELVDKSLVDAVS